MHLSLHIALLVALSITSAIFSFPFITTCSLSTSPSPREGLLLVLRSSPGKKKYYVISFPFFT
ncbi:hypothetical protein FDE64_16065 [Vibrio parahaemolyticus]|nr:hypothetical protein [Vibrio parahaemolyticus]